MVEMLESTKILSFSFIKDIDKCNFIVLLICSLHLIE
jgi:hypothetical protein